MLTFKYRLPLVVMVCLLLFTSCTTTKKPREITAKIIVGDEIDILVEPNTEELGYGLYSYVLFPHDSERIKPFLNELFKQFKWVEERRKNPEEFNLIYIPQVQDTKKKADIKLKPIDDLVHDYNYRWANKKIDQLLDYPAVKIHNLCKKDFSPGPYLFASTEPLSDDPPILPPYLLVDLSSVEPKIFGEFIVAFKEQVKSKDFSDGERFKSLRLNLLKVILAAAESTNNTIKALKCIHDIVYDIGSIEETWEICDSKN